MRSKRKKPAPSAPRHIYSTREIMEITEQRRLKEDAAGKKAEPEPKAPENEPVPVPVVEDLDPAPSVPVREESVKIVESENYIPAHSIAGVIVLVLSVIVFFLIVSSKSSASWVDPAAAKLNALIVYGSFIVLNILPGASTVQGAILSAHYYRVSLQGDWVALYSLELLIAFAALFIFFHKAAWIKWGKVFIALVPLAIIANILRVVMAFGLALNYGPAFADRYFHGILVGVVFIIILLGLMLFEFLSSSD